MTHPPYDISVLGQEDRSSFSSGSEPLDQYFRTQVGQDIRRRMAACYVATERASSIIAGYYTLSAADILVTDVSEVLTRKLPRYPTIPAVRLGRLAVDQNFQGKKLGSALLFDAIVRSARSEVAMHAMVVDAKDDNAAAFYCHHGFVSYGSSQNLLIAPLKVLLKAMK